MDLDEGLAQKLQAAVSKGRVVVLPRVMPSLGDWRGRAWLEIDPNTGDSGYMIDGLAGSFTERYQQWYSTGVGAISGGIACWWAMLFSA